MYSTIAADARVSVAVQRCWWSVISPCVCVERAWRLHDEQCCAIAQALLQHCTSRGVVYNTDEAAGMVGTNGVGQRTTSAWHGQPRATSAPGSLVVVVVVWDQRSGRHQASASASMHTTVVWLWRGSDSDDAGSTTHHRRQFYEHTAKRMCGVQCQESE